VRVQSRYRPGLFLVRPDLKEYGWWLSMSIGRQNFLRPHSRKYLASVDLTTPMAKVVLAERLERERQPLRGYSRWKAGDSPRRFGRDLIRVVCGAGIPKAVPGP
jgi:hypothetical protein